MTETPPRRWLYLKPLRSVAFISCLTLSVALGVLWQRSNLVYDVIHGSNSTVANWKGRVEYENFGPSSSALKRPLRWSCVSATGRQAYLDMSSSSRKLIRGGRFLGFEWGSTQYGRTTIAAPHWFLVMATLMPAIALRPKLRNRFSLFAAMAFMTLAAFIAGWIAWLVRLRG